VARKHRTAAETITVDAGEGKGSNITVTVEEVPRLSQATPLFGACPRLPFDVDLPTPRASSSSVFSLRAAVERESRRVVEALRSHEVADAGCAGLVLVGGTAMNHDEAPAASYAAVVRECRLVDECRERALPWLLNGSGVG
jgi:hypothetical protein